MEIFLATIFWYIIYIYKPNELIMSSSSSLAITLEKITIATSAKIINNTALFILTQLFGKTTCKYWSFL